MSTTLKTHRNYLAHVDGLRAVAILSVLLFHLHLPPFSGGFVGVDVFLVISGFLITGLIMQELEQTGRLSLRGFYFRRVRRIMPAFLVMLAATTLLMSLILSPAHLERFGASLLSASFGVSNIQFWLQADYFDTASKLKPLLHTWSLGVEEQFYLFWPLGLALCYRIGLKRHLPLIMVGVGGVSLWLNGAFSDGKMYLFAERYPHFAEMFEDGRATIFFLLPFRIYEFVMGGVLVWMNRAYTPSRRVADLLFVLGTGMIGYSVVKFNELMLFPGRAALVSCSGAAFLIVAGQASRFSVLLTNRFMVLVGLMSYSLYLVHWPIIVAWRYLFSDISLSAACGLTLVSLALAWSSWRFIERPLRNPDFWVMRRGVILGVGAVAAIVLLAGWSMYASGGWRFRVPQGLVEVEFSTHSSAYYKDQYGGKGYPYHSMTGPSSYADVVLLGDSHVRQYAEGMNAEFIKPKGLSMYVTGVSCFHLPGFTRNSAGENWDTMAPQSYSRGLSVILASERPPLVIVAHNWLWQRDVGALLNNEMKAVEKPLTDDDIIKGLLALKSDIGNAPLLVIGQIPMTGGIDLYDIFSRPWLVQRYVTHTHNYVKSPLIGRYQEFNDKLQNIADSTKAFTFLNPMDVLCEEGACDNLDDAGRLIYSDSTHFNKNGSRYMIRRFLPEIEAAYADRPIRWSEAKR